MATADSTTTSGDALENLERGLDDRVEELKGKQETGYEEIREDEPITMDSDKNGQRWRSTKDLLLIGVILISVFAAISIHHRETAINAQKEGRIQELLKNIAHRDANTTQMIKEIAMKNEKIESLTALLQKKEDEIEMKDADIEQLKNFQVVRNEKVKEINNLTEEVVREGEESRKDIGKHEQLLEARNKLYEDLKVVVRKEAYLLATIDLRKEMNETILNLKSEHEKEVTDLKQKLDAHTKWSSTDRTVKINMVDMREDMQNDAIRFANVAFDKHISAGRVSDIAEYINEEFTNKYGGTWQCFVGRHFGGYGTWNKKHVIFFTLGQASIILFKSPYITS